MQSGLRISNMISFLKKISLNYCEDISKHLKSSFSHRTGNSTACLLQTVHYHFSYTGYGTIKKSISHLRTQCYKQTRYTILLSAAGLSNVSQAPLKRTSNFFATLICLSKSSLGLSSPLLCAQSSWVTGSFRKGKCSSAEHGQDIFH